MSTSGEIYVAIAASEAFTSDKRVGRLVEHEREAHFVAVDADVILDHSGLYDIFARGGITHVFERVENQLGI